MSDQNIKIFSYRKLIKILKKYPKAKPVDPGLIGESGYWVRGFSNPKPHIRIGWSEVWPYCIKINDTLKQQLINELISEGYIVEVEDNLAVNIVGLNL